VGRLVVRLPHRIRPGDEVKVVVDDVADQTLESLKEDYGDAFASPAKALLTKH